MSDNIIIVLLNVLKSILYGIIIIVPWQVWVALIIIILIVAIVYVFVINPITESETETETETTKNYV